MTAKSGLDPRMLIAGDFVILRMGLVDHLGGDFEAAIVLQRIAWRCERTGEWQATYADLMDETRLSERKVKRAVTVLRNRGLLASRRRAPHDPTLVWSIVFEAGNVLHVKDETSFTAPPAQTSASPDVPAGQAVNDETSFTTFLEDVGEDVSAPAADASVTSPVQALVGAYVEAVESGGGIATGDMRAAIGRNVKRLIERDRLDPAVVLVAVQRAGAERQKNCDRFLGDAKKSYDRGGAARRAMFAAWEERAARIDGQQLAIGATA